MKKLPLLVSAVLLTLQLQAQVFNARPQGTQKPVLHGNQWMATSGPINAIYFDWKHGSFWGGSSNHGEDYGIGW